MQPTRSSSAGQACTDEQARALARAAVVTTLPGMIGLALASLGLYGVLTYSVIQRTREIGIRMSVGADQYSVRLMVFLQGAMLVGAGLMMGLPVALAVARLLRGLLNGLSPNGPIIFIAIALILNTVAITASYFPARRATLTNLWMRSKKVDRRIILSTQVVLLSLGSSAQVQTT